MAGRGDDACLLGRTAKMPGIDWRAWERSDWRRVPGGSRRYRNVHTGVEISRRQFDEHYGSAAAFRTYERKAAHKAAELEAPLRPARGRKSARKLIGKAREEEILARREAALQKRIAEITTRKHLRRPRTLTNISGSNFKRGSIGRHFELPVDYVAIESFRQQVKSWGHAFGYFVGVNFIDTRSGETGSFSGFKLRSISKPFTIDDMRSLIAEAEEKDYIEVYSCFMYVALDINYARRRGYKK